MRRLLVAASIAVLISVPANARIIHQRSVGGVPYPYAAESPYAPGYGGYAYAPVANPYGHANAGSRKVDYISPSRGLNRGQGPGCIGSPASIEFTGCN